MSHQRTSRLTMLFVVALALLMGCGIPATTPTATLPTPATSQPRAIVIDTDMAADDWMAILYLLQRLDVAVRAITVTGTGEAHCAPGIRHALGLAALSGYDKILVACGRETPLQGNYAFPDSWRKGVDSLLGLTLLESRDTASNQTAVELLASVIQSSPVKVTLLTLGPLTNVAEALQKNPSLVDNIEKIYIMGGAVDVPGNVGASGVGINNKTAEWNIYVDPYAANIVLQSSVPITLVGLDATNHVPLTAKFYNQLESNHTSSEATFVFDVLTKLKAFIDDSGGYYFWDPLVAAILADESLATFQNKNLCVVEKEGPESGWTKSGNGCPEVRVAVSADGGRFEEMFLNTLNIP
jgi:pyrimidine-specific ribonucleoside hydrolase